MARQEGGQPQGRSLFSSPIFCSAVFIAELLSKSSSQQHEQLHLPRRITSGIPPQLQRDDSVLLP